MRPGQHAAPDGSFGRSSGMAAGRAAVLLAVAVVLGVVLLNAADDSPRRVSAGRTTSTVTTAVTTTSTTTTTAPLREPRDVKVISANGTTVQGAAGRVRDMLRTAGYNVLAPGDTRRADASAVYFTPTYEREAMAVAEVLALPPTAVQALPDPSPVVDLRGANVVVVVGADLAQRVVPGAGAARTTTTAARARTTTTARRATSTTTTTMRATSTTTTTQP